MPKPDSRRFDDADESEEAWSSRAGTPQVEIDLAVDPREALRQMMTAVRAIRSGSAVDASEPTAVDIKSPGAPDKSE